MRQEVELGREADGRNLLCDRVAVLVRRLRGRTTKNEHDHDDEPTDENNLPGTNSGFPGNVPLRKLHGRTTALEAP
jgi:hypothetical protein